MSIFLNDYDFERTIRDYEFTRKARSRIREMVSSESFLLICILSDFPLYAEVWESSYGLGENCFYGFPAPRNQDAAQVFSKASRGSLSSST